MPPAIHYSLSSIHCPAARHYHPSLSIWLSVDPMADKYPSTSPYTYCANNPVRLVDPDGRDWYEDVDGAIHWTEYKSQSEMDEAEVRGRYLGEAHIVFTGSRYEQGGTKDGKGNYIDGDGACNARVTVYGPGGSDDIHHFTGYTMTSNSGKYIPIDEGFYEGTFGNKGGALPSRWALTGKIPTMDGIPNTNPETKGEWNYNTPWKTGIYIHSTGSKGNLGTRNSTGCLLILDSDWTDFTEAMSAAKSFSVRVERYAVGRVPLEGVNGVVPNKFATSTYLKRY